jgi:hypothetical protein
MSLAASISKAFRPFDFHSIPYKHPGATALDLLFESNTMTHGKSKIQNHPPWLLIPLPPPITRHGDPQKPIQP